jgi:hypothetical protein
MENHFWVTIGDSEAKIHIGRFQCGFKFAWDIQAILTAVLLYLPLSVTRKEEVSRILKTVSVCATGFHIDPYGEISLKDDVPWRLFQEGVPMGWIDDRPAIVTPIDVTEISKTKRCMRIVVPSINEALFLYWIRKLLTKGTLTSTNMCQITKENFVNLALSYRGSDACSHAAGFAPDGIYWNYCVGNLYCDPATKSE